jgi:hypothetical protein
LVFDALIVEPTTPIAQLTASHGNVTSHDTCTGSIRKPSPIITVKGAARGGDGLDPGHQYLTWRLASAAVCNSASVADEVRRSALDWYQGHNIAATGSVLSDLIRLVSAEGVRRIARTRI